MVKNHLKRIACPRTWHIARKGTTFITRPKPGAHPLQLAVSLSVFMRTMGKVAKSAKEAKKMLHDKEVFVDGKRRKDPKLPVGLMDVISFPAANEHFLVLIDSKGRLKARPLQAADTKSKLSRIESKSRIKGGRTQLNMSDGRNILVEKDTFKTGATLQLELPSQKILNHISFEKGVLIFLAGGKYAGSSGVLTEINGGAISFEDSNKQMISTAKKYAFIIGKEKPLIPLL